MIIRTHILDGRIIVIRRSVCDYESLTSSKSELYIDFHGNRIDTEALKKFLQKQGKLLTLKIDVDAETNRKFGYAVFDDFDPVDKLCIVQASFDFFCFFLP